MSPTGSRARREIGLDEARARIDGATLQVPASIANLGPGFDALAVAVQLFLRVRVRVLDGSRNDVRCLFDGVALDGENYIARSVHVLADAEGVDFPSLELSVESDIPMQAGLGSSAAAIVAGLLLYDELSGPAERDLLSEATALEGHPDNVAAALLGGLTTGVDAAAGGAIALSTPWPTALRFVAATPEARVKTPEARRILPDSLSREDAVFNLQRACLLLQAVQSGRTELLREALADRWHQPYRAPLVPGFQEALELECPGLLGVCLSGSGPTVVAICSGDTDEVADALRAIYARQGVECRVRTLAAHNTPSRVIRAS
jgi:homoserine kinase